MGAWMWGAVVLAVVLVIAGGITFWLAKGCVVTIIGAVGAIVGSLVSIGCLVALIDSDIALRVSYLFTAGSGVWLLAWALAGGIRGQEAARAELAAAAAIAGDRVLTDA